MIRCGSTGMTMPKPSMSMRTIVNTTPIEARCGIPVLPRAV
jgi:hypothetical protein